MCKIMEIRIKQVLMAIFLQMNIQGLRDWNGRTNAERRGLWEKEEQK